MKHSHSINLSQNCIDQIIQGSDDAFDILKNEISEHDLEIIIDKYDHYNGTRGEIYNPVITDGNINQDGNGSLVIQYDVEYYFGCDDFNRLDEDEMEINISIDTNNCTAKLVGPEEIIRDPDDY